MRFQGRVWSLIGGVLAVLAFAGPARPASAEEAEAQAPADPEPKPPEKKESIFDLPLDRLGQVPARVPVASGFDTPVSSVTREALIPSAATGSAAATVGKSPAAIYVISQEDLHRSAFLNIPESLRMVPGLDVARIDANKWAISSRGFNERFANKLLVQMDGRTLYTPLFSGVFWDVQDTFMDDIDRIEVIRGPGATLWGSNAVNGVINIITKSAQDTQGVLMLGEGGLTLQGEGAVRYGFQVADNAWMRVYGKYFDIGPGPGIQGQPGHDGWFMTRGGFRFDWNYTPQDTITFQGDVYGGLEGETAFTPLAPNGVNQLIDPSGWNLVGRWTHRISPESDVSLQVFYDHTFRATGEFSEVRDTADVDFQSRFPLTPNQEVVWGLGYRMSADAINNTPDIVFTPDRRTLHLASVFLQDDMTLVKDRLHFIWGSKFEYNSYVNGVEMQPSARLLWTPSEQQTVWASASRAVRTPSRAELNIAANTQFVGPLLVQIQGDPALASEDLDAYELGYRVSPNDRLFFDVASFYNHYDHLHTQVPLPPAPPILPLFIVAESKADTYGVEVAANWKVTDAWKLRSAYTFLIMDVHTPPAGLPAGQDIDGQSPRNQFNIRSFLDLSRSLQCDLGMYYVDSLPGFGIPSYTRLDARVGWRPRCNLEVVLGLQNLLEPFHPEFGSPTGASTLPTQAQRLWYGLIRWKF